MIDKSCAILNEISTKASLSHKCVAQHEPCSLSLSLINDCINLNQLLFPIPIQIQIPRPREEDSRMMMKIKKRLMWVREWLV